MLPVKLILVYSFLIPNFYLALANTCKGDAKCTALPTCVPFMNLIVSMGKPLNPPIVTFLKNQQCGFGQKYPLVCCSTVPKRFKVTKQIHASLSPGPELLPIPLPELTEEEKTSVSWTTKRKKENANPKATTISSTTLYTSTKATWRWDDRKLNKALSEMFYSSALLDYFLRRKRSDDKSVSD